MSAFEKTRLTPERSTPCASISTSLVSPPWAPAFMRSAPPIDPGTPRKKARPSTPARRGRLGDELVGRSCARDHAGSRP